MEGLYLTENMGATRLANSENGTTILSFNAKDYVAHLAGTDGGPERNGGQRRNRPVERSKAKQSPIANRVPTEQIKNKAGSNAGQLPRTKGPLQRRELPLGLLEHGIRFWLAS